jgi:tetratricopeptide (TPR) repeat protein
VKPDAAKLLAELKERLRIGEPESAVQAYARYLEAEPKDALAWTDMADLLVVLQRPDEALVACRKTLALKPGQISAQCHMGGALLQLGRLDEAEALFRKVLAVEPRRIEARLSLAKCLLKKRDLEAARATLEKVLLQDPVNVSAHQFLGQIFYGQGQWPEFRAELERFRTHDPSSDYLEFECGFENLLRGVMPLGWRQWEARLRVPGCVGPERNFTEPRWNGEPFQGRTLLVHYEQGFGDTIMLARFLPQVKARGGRVLLLVQPQLADLMTTCQGVDQIISQGEPLPSFDLQVSLYSLPAVFQMDQNSLSTEIPYLGVPALVPNRQRIAEILAASDGRIRVGLVWAGNTGHARDAERSLPIDLVNRLGVLPDVAWHGFQLGMTEEPSLPDYVSLAPLLSNFSDTAYALSGMDLVITVDTALVHLAGAFGIPTLLLVTYVPDFRWMLDRDDSPWYPTVRIHRQPQPGDWDSVVSTVVSELTTGM